MKLNDLLKDISFSIAGDQLPDMEITDITADSRKAGPGIAFVCIPGERADGHDFAAGAVKAGCPVVIAQRDTGAPAPHILVEDTRLAYAFACANYFGRPADHLRLVGITGTNGKTTTSTLIKEILEASGHPSGLIGTICNMAGQKVLPSHLTTPEPYEFQKLLRAIADEGCEFAIMEVSSHALAQERVAGCHFEAAVFTNLTQDHLDFHKTMENYMHAKQKLFKMADLGIINADDSHAEDFIKAATCKTVTYSARYMNATYTARNINLKADGVEYEMVGNSLIGRVSASIPGGFSVYNTLAAAACAVSLGIPFRQVLEAMHHLGGVKGRIEVVPTGRDFTVIIDYAHTPDALEKILKATHEFSKGRVVAVFGCGGDRDKTKRPIMGMVAAQNADFCVVTSDNPRTEDPQTIIDDIMPGVESGDTPYAVVVNRREAIAFAMKNAQKDDVILLAGKGHEDYQIIGTEKHHFDEREVVADILKRLPPRGEE